MLHWSQHFKADEILKATGQSRRHVQRRARRFHIKEFRMLCQCSQCLGAGKSMSATEFEKHAGMGQAKKWKASIRMVEPARMPIGRWLDGGMKAGGSSRKGDAESRGGRARRGLAAGDRRKALGYKLVRVKWSVDRCAVCDDDRDFDFDQLVTCEGCGISVHQSCYGIPEIPDDAVGYLCAACEHTGGVASETPLCALCPVEGGALKPTTSKDQWCHSACCQWIPETTVLDVDRMEPIDQIKTIQRERWELLCTVCKQRMGAKIQCASPGCYLAYHPLCARAAGLFMEASLDDEDAEDPDADAPLRMVSYCHRHCRVDAERAKAWAVEESAAGAEKDKKGADEPGIDAAGSNKPPAVSDAKLSKAEREALVSEAKKREEEALSRRRARDDALDAPEDALGAARCRPYDASLYKGHPRTEAGEETIVAAGALRRALRHGVGDGDVKPRGRSRDGRKRREREAWVQCETCSKWRRVRQSVAEAFARADAGQWTCSISEHPRVNACDVPQELPDDDIDERVALGDKCPFYDDDDLDPPEVIREEEEEKTRRRLGRLDDSDDSDDLLEDAPPGGWTDPAAFAPRGETPSLAVDPLAETRLGAETLNSKQSDELCLQRERLGNDEARAEDGRAGPVSASEGPPASLAAADAESLEPLRGGVETGEAGEPLARESSVPMDDPPMDDPMDDPMDTEIDDEAEKETDAGLQNASAPKNGDARLDAPPSPANESREPSPAKSPPRVSKKPFEAPVPAAPLSDLPDVKVLCRYLEGVFRPRDNMIRCFCTRCRREQLWEPNRWEGHAGMRQAKKWKTSIRVVDPADQLDDAAKNEARKDVERRIASGEHDVEPVPDEVETALGDWLDRNGLVLEVVPAPRKGARKKEPGDDAGKPAKKPRRALEDADARRRRTGRAALAGLTIDLDLDLNKAADDVEERAAALVGRAARVNPHAGPNGAPLVLGGRPDAAAVAARRCRRRQDVARRLSPPTAFEEEADGDEADGDVTRKKSDWFTLEPVRSRLGRGGGRREAPRAGPVVPSAAAPTAATRRGMAGWRRCSRARRRRRRPLGRLFKPSLGKNRRTRERGERGRQRERGRQARRRG